MERQDNYNTPFFEVFYDTFYADLKSCNSARNHSAPRFFRLRERAPRLRAMRKICEARASRDVVGLRLALPPFGVELGTFGVELETIRAVEVSREAD